MEKRTRRALEGARLSEEAAHRATLMAAKKANHQRIRNVNVLASFEANARDAAHEACATVDEANTTEGKNGCIDNDGGGSSHDPRS